MPLHSVDISLDWSLVLSGKKSAEAVAMLDNMFDKGADAQELTQFIQQEFGDGAFRGGNRRPVTLLVPEGYELHIHADTDAGNLQEFSVKRSLRALGGGEWLPWELMDSFSEQRNDRWRGGRSFPAYRKQNREALFQVIPLFYKMKVETVSNTRTIIRCDDDSNHSRDFNDLVITIDERR